MAMAESVALQKLLVDGQVTERKIASQERFSDLLKSEF